MIWDRNCMDTFAENREKARQIFLDSPHSDPGIIFTGNLGEVNFLFLPQIEGDRGEYLVAKLAETCHRAGPGVDWLEYGIMLTFWFQGKPLQLLERESSSDPWKTQDGFHLKDNTLPVDTDGLGCLCLNDEQRLRAFKQEHSDSTWITAFSTYYGHHFGSVSSKYRFTIDLAKMEIRNLYSHTVDIDK